MEIFSEGSKGRIEARKFCALEFLFIFKFFPVPQLIDNLTLSPRTVNKNFTTSQSNSFWSEMFTNHPGNADISPLQ